jgi:hypothetical protein
MNNINTKNNINTIKMNTMKKIVFYIIIVLFVYSCQIDNYEAPGASLEGIIADANGTGLQLEQGSTSARLKMEEISWSSSPTPFYLNLKQDGTYVNTKVFAAEYNITPVEGPFYPVTAEKVEINGTTVHNFTVTPYLTVSWVGDPMVSSDKKVVAKFKFIRNASTVSGVSMPNLLDYQLFISTNKYCGNNNFDATIVGSVVKVSNSTEGQEITITSKTAMKYSTIYYVRIGVRVSDSFKKYNYTDIKAVTVP